MAEIAGLALGVVGVAGLYSVTLQVFEQISDAANFNRDFDTQQAKLKTALASLRLWGASTGLTADGNLLPIHDAVFDDDRILYDVQSALFCIKDACAQLRTCFDKSEASPATQPGAGNQWPRTRVKKKIVAAGKRLRWAFQEKTKVEDLLNQVICLVGLLYQIARPKDASSIESDNKLIELLNQSQEQSRKIADGLVGQAKELQRRKQEDIETWLDAPRTNTVYHSALSKALPGTCQWITEDRVLEQWIGQSPSSQAAAAQCVWLFSRIAGAGKTIAAARFVERLKEDPGRHVAYYFGTHEASTSHGFNGITRSWIHQLTRCYGWAAVETAYDASVEDDVPVEPWAILRSLLTGNPSTYLMLDGLDEVEEQAGKYTTTARADFLRNLLTAVKDTSTKVLIVSRYEQDIEQVFSAWISMRDSLDLIQSEVRLQQTAADIELVALHQVSTMFPDWSEEQRKDVATSLVQRADGMFVLLHAILEQLGRESSYSYVQYAVSQPLSNRSNTDMLQHAYQNKIERMLGLPATVRDFCLSVLLWVQQSVRPLKVGELIDILQVMSRKDEDASEVPRIASVRDLDSCLLRHCPIFLSLRNDSEIFNERTLHLAHYSVKEFLHSTGALENAKFKPWKLFQSQQLANAFLSTACLTYLLQSDFAKYPAKQVSGASRGVFEYKEGYREVLKREHMFYDYAASYWWRHLDLSCSKPDLVSFIDSGASTIKKDGANTNLTELVRQAEQLLEVMSSKETKGYEKFLPLDAKLHSLCLEFLGLRGDSSCCNYKIWRHYRLGIWTTDDDDRLAHAREQLEYPSRLFSRDWTTKAHWRVVDMYMWQSHLFSTYRDSRRLRLQSRLLEAMCLPSTGTMAILVEEGADINFTWPDHRRMLELYSHQRGHSSNGMLFHVFLTHFGASTELNKPVFPVHIPINGTVFRAGGGGWLNPRMLWAFLFGNVLQRKVLNAWNFDEPGLYSPDTSDLVVIRAMIFWHIEVNNRSLFHPSSVHAAVLNSHASALSRTQVLHLLFSNGGDANVGPWLRPVSTFGRDNPRETLWEMLLQLLPSSGVPGGRTFGSLLILLEHDDKFWLHRDELLSAVIAKDVLSGNSAGWVKHEKLQLATRKGDEKEVKRLIESGVNVNKCGNWYGSALYVASYTGNKRMVELLLEHNADPNVAVSTRILPLELERDFEWAGLWRKSLAREGVMYYPLQAAAARGHHDVVKLLLERGAEVNRTEGEAGTALYFAVRASMPKYIPAEWSQARIKGDKLEYWKELNAKDRERSMALIRLLVDSGADVNKCGGRYWTPLQAACAVGEVLVVVYLLAKKADPNIVGGEWGTALQAGLAHYPDPDVEAVEKGHVYDPEEAPFQAHWSIRPYALFVLLFRVFPMPHDLIELARDGAPDDIALLLTYALLEVGADPTILGGLWGSAIHAAAFFSSFSTLQLLLDSKYSSPTARMKAANASGGKLGLAINGAIIAGRPDKIRLLLRDAQAEYHFLPLLYWRLRHISTSTFRRLRGILGLLWTLRDVLIVTLIIGGATAVALPVQFVWEEMDRKAREWDPRLGGLWMLFSLLAAGYVTNLRQTWAEDTAW